MYLGDVLEGGETALPLGKFINEERQRAGSLSKQALMVPLPRHPLSHRSSCQILPRKLAMPTCAWVFAAGGRFAAEQHTPPRCTCVCTGPAFICDWLHRDWLQLNRVCLYLLWASRQGLWRWLAAWPHSMLYETLCNLFRHSTTVPSAHEHTHEHIVETGGKGLSPVAAAQVNARERAAAWRWCQGRVMRCCSGTCMWTAQLWTGPACTQAAPHSR